MEEKPLYLGGLPAGDICGFEQIVRNTLSDVPNLRCDHEEADDRLMLYTADAPRYSNEKLSQHHLIPIFLLLHYTAILNGYILILKNYGWFSKQPGKFICIKLQLSWTQL